MAVSKEEFRSALAHRASGVTIVTSRDGDEVRGMTVSAFSSVSLDPPLVLVCADRASDTRSVIDRSGVFAVHVLGREQQALSALFADKAREQERFRGLGVERARTGAPILPGALVALDCRVVARHEAGDHLIYVGRVEAIREREGEPLLYYRGRYRELG